MNLIKQNQLFDEMFQFYCDECRKTKTDLINPKGSDTKLKTIFVGILYRDYNFSGQFLSENKEPKFTKLSFIIDHWTCSMFSLNSRCK